MKLFKNKKGFSLVELLVVISIMAILSVAAFQAIGSNSGDARDARRQQDLSTMQSALELYVVEFSSYPDAPLTNGENTGSPNTGAVPRKYLSPIPTDPKDGTSYYYWTDGSTYIIGAVLENEGSPVAYIVGNSDSTISDAGDDNAIGAGSSCDIAVGITTCFPYDI